MPNIMSLIVVYDRQDQAIDVREVYVISMRWSKNTANNIKESVFDQIRNEHDHSKLGNFVVPHRSAHESSKNIWGCKLNEMLRITGHKALIYVFLINKK